MSNLKNRVARLAHEQPALRAALVPLLRVAKEVKPKDVKVGDLIEVDNHYFVVTKNDKGDLYGVQVKGPSKVNSVSKKNESLVLDSGEFEGGVEVLHSGIKVD